MQNLSVIIKQAIENEYGSVAKFSRLIDIPYSTLNNILKNGIDNSKYSMIVELCKKLKINIFEQNNIIFSDSDMQFISKFTRLDKRAEKLIESIVEEEYKRCIKF